MYRHSRNRSFLSDTEDDASVVVASRQATSTNTASRNPRGTPEPRDPPNVVLIKRTTHKTVRIETTVVTEEFAPVPLQTGDAPVPPRAAPNALVGIRSNGGAKVKSDNTTSRPSSRNVASAIQTPMNTTSQRSSTLITRTTADLSTDSSDSDSASPILVQRMLPDSGSGSFNGLSPLPVKERSVAQIPCLHEAPTPLLDFDTKIKVCKGKARSPPRNSGQIPRQYYHIPHPAELQEYEASHYYIVTVGQIVGIFSDWEFVNSIIQGVSGATQSRCSTWGEAFHRYTKAFNGGLVKRRVLKGSLFDDGFDDDDVRSDGTFLNEHAAVAGPSNSGFF